MKRLKSIFIILMTTIMSVVLVGCNGVVMDVTKETQQAEDVFNYLKDKDAEGLKSLFCDKIIESSEDLDDQIKEAMDFFDGKIVSYEQISSGSGGSSNRNGKTVELSATPHIKGIITDTGEKYEVFFNTYIIYTDYEDRVGISQLTIKSDDGRKCVVGDFYKVNPEYK